MLVGRKTRSLLGLALLSGILSFGGQARADEPQPVISFAPDASPPPHTRTQVLLLGAATTAVFYGAAVGASYIWEQDRGAADLRIPVVGPWLKLGQTAGCAAEDTTCTPALQIAGAVLAALDGIGQAGGLALLLEGLFMKTAPGTTGSGSANLSLGAQPRGQLGGTFSSHWVVETGGVTFVPVPFAQAGSDLGIAIVGTF